jgi:hypothetical protein
MRFDWWGSYGIMVVPSSFPSDAHSSKTKVRFVSLLDFVSFVKTNIFPIFCYKERACLCS